MMVLTPLSQFNDDRYFEIRPNIALSTDKVFDIGNDLALNSELRSSGFMRSNLAIWRLFKVSDIPGQNRSHFKSIALWETGGDGSQAGKNGWLTEDIEGITGSDKLDAHGISLDGGMGVFLSSSGVWLSMTSINQFSSLSATTEKIDFKNTS